ncbi:hypothetical protein [Nonomuraea africana]|uniref:Mce-associated membrane protein n=1 Tax=Nonomuraea africana TaxID=46171 RepID=A0ABR9KNM5_9ACTN|nr:hypothetical protein [Nonomuraea africana]MBE1563366.1 hypothetical protein [Nonomuraea africana]
MAQPGDKRGLAFAAIVLVLAAVGIFVTMWPDSETAPPTSGQEVTAGRTGSGSAAAPAVVTPLATASDAPFDIYSFLPMTKQELAAAADLAERFTAAYGTFRYDEDPAVYAGRLKVFTTTGLADVLTRTITSPGTVEANRADEVVSQATAKVKEIRQVDRTSIVFVVTGTREVSAKSGPTRRDEAYAVTMQQMGSDWRVFDLQPADEGQDGDSPG